MRTRKVNPVNHEIVILDRFGPEKAVAAALDVPILNELRRDKDIAKRGQQRQVMQVVSVAPAHVGTFAPGTQLQEVKIAGPVKGRYFAIGFEFI